MGFRHFLVTYIFGKSQLCSPEDSVCFVRWRKKSWLISSTWVNMSVAQVVTGRRLRRHDELWTTTGNVYKFWNILWKYTYVYYYTFFRGTILYLKKIYQELLFFKKVLPISLSCSKMLNRKYVIQRWILYKENFKEWYIHWVLQMPVCSEWAGFGPSL